MSCIEWLDSAKGLQLISATTMTSREDKGTTAAAWLKAEISRLFYSDTPVTAVLEITIKIDLQPDTISTADAQVTRNRQRAGILLKFHEVLGAKRGFNPRIVNLDGNPIAIPFRAKNDQSTHLYSIAGHNESVKAAYMKLIVGIVDAQVRQWTAQAQPGNLRWDLIKSASVIVTLAHVPLAFTIDIQAEVPSDTGEEIPENE